MTEQAIKQSNTVMDICLRTVTKKPQYKWSDFERAKLTLKIMLASWILLYFGKRIKSFYAKKMGSVGRRALKLIALKVEGLKKKFANLPRPYSNHSAQIWLHPGSNHSQTLTAKNLKALWPTDFVFTAIKDLNF